MNAVKHSEQIISAAKSNFGFLLFIFPEQLAVK